MVLSLRKVFFYQVSDWEFYELIQRPKRITLQGGVYPWGCSIVLAGRGMRVKKRGGMRDDKL